MQPAGLAAFQRRKDNRSKIYSYEQGDVNLPKPYAEGLLKNKRAASFVESQYVSYRKAACWWVISARKDKTRQSRLETLIELSQNGKLIPQFRPRLARKRL
jgi:uncharacterized protein YdeI (YjbR/CyaY-like superfamily)